MTEQNSLAAVLLRFESIKWSFIISLKQLKLGEEGVVVVVGELKDAWQSLFRGKQKAAAESVPGPPASNWHQSKGWMKTMD